MKRKSFVYKDVAGQAWFVGVYSNNFEDREDQTLSWSAHNDYAKWVNDTGVKLPVTVMHQPKYPVEVHIAQFTGLANGTFTAEEFSENYMKLYKPFAFAQTEAVIPLNGFMLVVAKILPDKESAVKLLSKAGWGMSHGYLTVDRGKDVVDIYRSFEFTSLPVPLAANTITVSSIQELIKEMDESKGLSDKDREILKQALNADPEDVEEATAAAQQILQKVLASKEVNAEEAEEAEETDQPENQAYEEIRDKLFEELGADALSEAFKNMLSTVQKLCERMDAADERITQTEKSEDEKIAEQLTPRTWAWDAFKTEGTDELTDDEKEALKKGAVGEEKLDGVDALDKAESEADPISFTWKTLVAGKQ